MNNDRPDLRFTRARIERSRRGHDLHGGLTFESEHPIWEALRDQLVHYYSADLDLVAHETGVQPEDVRRVQRALMPAEMAFYLADTLDVLITAGEMPEAWEVLRRVGGHHLPSQVHDIRAGLLYIGEVRAGVIDDSSPIESVAEWFRVTKRTVQRWKRKYEPLPSMRQDRSCEDWAVFLEIFTRKAGEHFHVFAHRKTWGAATV